MNLPVEHRNHSRIDELEQMAEIVDEEDVKMFVINNKRDKKKQQIDLAKLYHPKQTIAKYFKDNKR